MNPAHKKVILKIKSVKAQKDLTYQDIVDACEAQGDAVSLSTVKRIFAKGSEDGPDCRTSTLNAIFHAVVGTEDMELTEAEEAALTETGKEAVAENAVLKAVIELRDATIQELQAQISALITENQGLKAQLDAMQIRLDATINLFRAGMESLGRGVGQ